MEDTLLCIDSQRVGDGFFIVFLFYYTLLQPHPLFQAQIFVGILGADLPEG